jgi:hypothetical protein
MKPNPILSASLAFALAALACANDSDVDTIGDA